MVKMNAAQEKRLRGIFSLVCLKKKIGENAHSPCFLQKDVLQYIRNILRSPQ